MHSPFILLIRRTLANLLDTSIELTGGVLGSYFGMIVAALLETTGNSDAAHMQSSMWSGFGLGLIFWTIAISFVNRVLVQGISRASIGKKVFKLELISNGHALNWNTVVGRWLLGFGSFAIFGAGYFYALFNRDHRTMHDVVTNTDVVPSYVGSTMTVEHKDYIPMPMPAYSTMYLTTHKILILTQVTAERPTVSMIRMPFAEGKPAAQTEPSNVISLDEARANRNKATVTRDDSSGSSEAA